MLFAGECKNYFVPSLLLYHYSATDYQSIGVQIASIHPFQKLRRS